MGWLKKALKKVVRVVKAVVRLVVRLVTFVLGLVLGIIDLLVGFVARPQKKLRLHIVILADQNGPLVAESLLTPSIEFARKTFKDRFNVQLLPYGESMIETVTIPAPMAALNVRCGPGGLGDEFGEAGDFFASHLAGWNAAPVSLSFPLTVFIVSAIANKNGCSMGPLTDYVTLDPIGVDHTNTMAHEIGHACDLWHSGTQSNLMYKDNSRGDTVKWFQKNLFRSSRHVTYW